jgi:flagellar hook-associated protein 3 FlgL
MLKLDPLYTSNLVNSLDSVQASQQQLTNQISSGLRVNSLSDDPAAVGENVVLLNKIQQDDTFTQTSNVVKGQLQVADTTLGSVVSELTTAISLATSANNGTLNSSNVKTIATQLQGILAEVQSLANTSYQGSYIFAGTNTGTAPFTTSSTTSPSVTTYNGNSSVNYISTPNGQQIQLNVPGSQIFLGSGTSSVFGALNALIADYSSGTVDTATAVADTTSLNTALNYVSQQRVTIDSSISQLSAASEAATTEKTQLTSTQTDLMQADVASLSTKLALASTQSSALESVIVQLESASNSLFSKL